MRLLFLSFFWTSAFALILADEVRMKPFGVVATQTLITLRVDEQDRPVLRLDSNELPVHPPEGSVLPVVELDKPAHDATTQAAEPVLVWFSDRVERQWTLRNLTAKELAARAEAAGYTVQPEGWVLPLNKADRNSFTQMLVLVNLSKERGLITDETPQKITDKYGQPHVLTTGRYIDIMLAYGAYYKALWDDQQ